MADALSIERLENKMKVCIEKTLTELNIGDVIVDSQGKNHRITALMPLDAGKVLIRTDTHPKGLVPVASREMALFKVSKLAGPPARRGLRAFARGYQMALRDVLAAWERDGAQAAEAYIKDNLAETEG